MIEAKKETIVDDKGQFPQIKCYRQIEEGVTDCCPTHYHTHIELIYCLNGKFDIWLNNERYCFGTGDMAVIASGDIHLIRSVEEGQNDYIVLQIDPEIIYNMDLKCTFPFLFGSNEVRKIFHNSELYNTKIPSLFYRIYELMPKQEFGCEFEMKINVCRIYLWIMRMWESESNDTESLSDIRMQNLDGIRKTLDYINTHYGEEISAQEMSKIANMSYSYFSRIFKRVTGRNFNDYLSMVRVKEAEKMLIMSDMSITEIAVLAGFSSSSYFIKIFSGIKGISPGKYRQQFNEKTN